MGGDLRALPDAGRLQRTLAMRTLRVASAVVLSLVALLAWQVAGASLPRAYDRGESVAVSSAVAQHAGSTVGAQQRLTNRKAGHSSRIGGRNQILARSRATDGEGDPTPTSVLAAPPTALLGDVAESARARLRWLALAHAPHGEPSPFDATAPPTPRLRNG